ncbi:hypothetical protein CH380_09100 [Leptospira adleri]|uniref:Uncharacterized protein n=1 Tax=Leptospira adleri TaxID=2023186 RepID=A0A2M9YQE9_9LEPT|nr:hypothetical protein CH380_09100 [Leptospira adleri]PJZ61246.1 hypothetical protein CH376_14140 [Leptospira adleri]
MFRQSSVKVARPTLILGGGGGFAGKLGRVFSIRKFYFLQVKSSHSLFVGTPTKRILHLKFDFSKGSVCEG